MAPDMQNAAPAGAAVRGNHQAGQLVNREYTKTDQISQPDVDASTIVPTEGVYVASDIKRFRRTKAAVSSIRDGIRQILEEDNPQTVRQVFYALTVRGLI